MRVGYKMLPCVKCGTKVRVKCDLDNMTSGGLPRKRGAVLCKEHTKENNRLWRGRTGEEINEISRANVSQGKVFKAGDPEFERLSKLYQR